MRARRAAAAMIAVLAVAGCAPGTAGTATVNSGAVLASTVPPAGTATTRSPAESGPDASITVLAGGVRGVPGDLAAVATETAGHGQAPWRMTVADGRVTGLEEIYLP